MISAFVLASIISNFPGVHVIKVTDGDTFQVTLPGVAAVFGERISVRLEGIDAPELHDERLCAVAAAEEAREALEAMLSTSSTVDLIGCVRDKYFRLRCKALNDAGLDVSELMLSAKLVLEYDGRKKARWVCRRGR